MTSNQGYPKLRLNVGEKKKKENILFDQNIKNIFD